METRSKLFLILLFVGLTSNVFAMKRKKRKLEGDKKFVANKQHKNSNQKIEQSHLLSLPGEIIKHILKIDLSAQDLARICMTCTRLNSLAKPIKSLIQEWETATREWETAREDLDKLRNFIKHRGEDLKTHNLQHIFYACLQIAQAQLNDKHSWVRKAALYENMRFKLASLHVLKALVEQGQDYPEALQAAQAQLNDENLLVLCKEYYTLHLSLSDHYYTNLLAPELLQAALLVLQALVEKGQYYPEVFKAAQAKLNNENWLVRLIAEELQSLVEEMGASCIIDKSK